MKKLWKRRSIRVLLFCVGLLLLLFSLRVPLMRAAGNYLIAEEGEVTEVVFVLGGNSLDRGGEALQLHREGKAKTLVCLGANIPGILEAVGMNISEGELTYRLLAEKLPAGNVHLLEEGTSTREEAVAILAYCKANNIAQATILSDKFHLRRVQGVFNDPFEEAGIRLSYYGADCSKYDEERWWDSEEGMIMVNNEYMKLLYYAFN